MLDIMVQKRALMSDKDVAVMVAASTEGDPVVYRVGTVTDIPAGKYSVQEGPSEQSCCYLYYQHTWTDLSQTMLISSRSMLVCRLTLYRP